MLGKRKARAIDVSKSKRRKGELAIEEITFDPTARQEYLTGFHKRKLQRAKHAQDLAAKKEREGRIENRKLLRENRKADIEAHITAVNATIANAENGEGSGLEDDFANEAEGEWEGFQEEPRVDHEEEYIDEDRFTTVTVEAVDVTREGLTKAKDDEGEESESANGDSIRRETVDGSRRNGSGDKAGGKRLAHSKSTKPRKKKFKYENKAERKITRLKQRAGNRLKAKERKE